MVGKAMKFPVGENEPFRIFGLPKSLLVEFRILSKPCSVIRDVTLTAIEMLEHASKKSSADTRIIFTGSTGSGKSFLLLQAVEYAVANNWVVLYIPRGVNLVNSTTPHSYDLRTQTYLQPVFAYQTLQRMLTVNAKAFETLKTQSELTFEKRSAVPVGTSLKDLVNVGLKDQSLATIVLEALLAELGNQQTHPVLLAVDEVQAIFGKTAYRDPHFAPIQTQHLSMPRLLLEYLGGKKTFNRGAVLGAINSSDPVYKTSLELSEALNLPTSSNVNAGPYAKRSAALQEYAKGIRSLPVPERLAVSEAASLFEVWMKDKALISETYDETFLSKYSEASGNPRNFVWKGLLSTLAM
jgi:small subunit ribosomal protein S29